MFNGFLFGSNLCLLPKWSSSRFLFQYPASCAFRMNFTAIGAKDIILSFYISLFTIQISLIAPIVVKILSREGGEIVTKSGWIIVDRQKETAPKK